MSQRNAKNEALVAKAKNCTLYFSGMPFSGCGRRQGLGLLVSQSQNGEFSPRKKSTRNFLDRQKSTRKTGWRKKCARNFLRGQRLVQSEGLTAEVCCSARSRRQGAWRVNDVRRRGEITLIHGEWLRGDLGANREQA